MFTAVVHHLYFYQHSLSVWELRTLTVKVLKVKFFPILFLIYDFICSKVWGLSCDNLIISDLLSFFNIIYLNIDLKGFGDHCLLLVFTFHKASQLFWNRDFNLTGNVGSSS